MLLTKVEFWAVLVSLVVAAISCTGSGTTELGALPNNETVSSRVIAEEDSAGWFATNSDGEHVSLREVVPVGFPAVVYFFAPG